MGSRHVATHLEPFFFMSLPCRHAVPVHSYSGQPPPYTINTNIANINAGANVGKEWRQQVRETGARDTSHLELQVHFSFLPFPFFD